MGKKKPALVITLQSEQQVEWCEKEVLALIARMQTAPTTQQKKEE